MWKKNDVQLNEISVLSTITPEKPHLFKPSMIELPKVVRVSSLDFFDLFDRNINNEVDEIFIIFISDLKDIELSHYMDQPKSMLCRKLVKNFLEKPLGILISIGFQIALDIYKHFFLCNWRQ